MDCARRRGVRGARRRFLFRRGHHGWVSGSNARVVRAGRGAVRRRERTVMSGPVTAAMPREEIERRVRELGDWFQNLDLNGVHTAPNHFLGDYPNFKWRAFEHAIPADLSGRTVLDIGCNAGFYSLEMKRRGAARVVGIDSDSAYLAQARFAA